MKRVAVAVALALVVLILGAVAAVLLLTGPNHEAPLSVPNAASPPKPDAAPKPDPAPKPAPKPQRPLPPFTYARYGNPRFGFFTDTPTFMKAEPAPENGDGQCWTWDSSARLCASGMHNVLEQNAKKECAATDPGLTYKHVSGNTCVKSGIRDGKVFWTRYTYARDIVFDLDLLYDEDLTQAFNPIVEHLNARLNVDAESSVVPGAP